MGARVSVLISILSPRNWILQKLDISVLSESARIMRMLANVSVCPYIVLALSLTFSGGARPREKKGRRAACGKAGERRSDTRVWTPRRCSGCRSNQ